MYIHDIHIALLSNNNLSRKKFEVATLCKSVSISTLELNRKYPIISAKRITTKIGPTILLTIIDSQEDPAQIFLPRRCSAVMADGDIENINTNSVSLSLVYRGVCAAMEAYQLAIVA